MGMIILKLRGILKLHFRCAYCVSLGLFQLALENCWFICIIPCFCLVHKPCCCPYYCHCRSHALLTLQSWFFSYPKWIKDWLFSRKSYTLLFQKVSSSKVVTLGHSHYCILWLSNEMTAIVDLQTKIISGNICICSISSKKWRVL